MPPLLGSSPSPVTLAGRAMPSAENGNLVTIEGTWEAYHRALGKPVRSEFDRSWRVFQRAPGARFMRVTDTASANRYLDVMDAQQAARLEEIGRRFTLDGPVAGRFYRQVVRDGLASGYVILTALETDAEIVATMLSFRAQSSMVVTRISNAGKDWSNCSPGRLIIHRTMMHLYDEGLRHFDFSIGNYDYKRRFGVTQTPLVDVVEPLSLRGMPAAAKARAIGALRRHPDLDRRLRTLFGK